MSHRLHVDNSILLIGKLLFGLEGHAVLNKVRPSGEPLVDDWDCLKSLVTFCIFLKLGYLKLLHQGLDQLYMVCIKQWYWPEDARLRTLDTI